MQRPESREVESSSHGAGNGGAPVPDTTFVHLGAFAVAGATYVDTQTRAHRRFGYTSSSSSS